MAQATLENIFNLDVSDPSDFPAEYLALRDLDTALRCTVCRDIFDAPVTLAGCAHTFCSLCARGWLADHGSCAACRKEANEAQLKPNVTLEQAVIAWGAARSMVLRLVQEDARRANSPPPRKRRRSSASPLHSIKPSTQSNALPRAERSLDTRTNASHELEDGLVECPICARRVPPTTINQHMDSGCKSHSAKPSSSADIKGAQKHAWSSLMSGKKKGKGTLENEEPLQVHSYDTLKDKDVQNLLKTHGLSTSGKRALWVARHKRWVQLYNANLDHAPEHRKSSSQLKIELSKWEASQHAGKKTVVADPITYQRENHSEFARLVDNVRQQRARPPPRGSSDDSRLQSDPVDTGHSRSSPPPHNGPLIDSSNGPTIHAPPDRQRTASPVLKRRRANPASGDDVIEIE